MQTDDQILQAINWLYTAAFPPSHSESTPGQGTLAKYAMLAQFPAKSAQGAPIYLNLFLQRPGHGSYTAQCVVKHAGHMQKVQMSLLHGLWYQYTGRY